MQARPDLCPEGAVRSRTRFARCAYRPRVLPRQGLLQPSTFSSPHLSSVRTIQRPWVCVQARDSSTQLEGSSSSPVPGAPEGHNGYVDLFICTFLWGTYGPAVRYIFANEAITLDPPTLMTIKGAIAALYMGVTWWLSQRKQAAQRSKTSNHSKGHGGEPSYPQQPRAVAETQPLVQASKGKAENSKPSSWIATLLNSTPKSLALAGFEIGLYNTAGACFEATGLTMCSATRGGFLLQLSALIVPILCVLAGEIISAQVASAVGVGLIGICMVTFDGLSSTPAALETVSAGGGELLLLCACFFYSMAVIRIGKFANKFDATALTAMEKLQGMFLALMWLVSSRLPGLLEPPPPEGALNAISAAGQALSSLNPMTVGLFWAVVAYTAIGPGAVASVLQTEGMRSVPATQSQLIFSLTPIWSAIIAVFTVGRDGSESMGMLSWIGAALIVAATLMAASPQKDDNQKDQQQDAHAEVVLQPVVVTVQSGMQGVFSMSGGSPDGTPSQFNQLLNEMTGEQGNAEEHAHDRSREFVEVGKKW